jgi:hypothetical protein
MGTKEKFKRYLQAAGGIPALIESVEATIPDVGTELLPELNAMTAQELSDLRDAMRGYKVYSARVIMGHPSEPTIILFENTSGVGFTWTNGGSGSITLSGHSASSFIRIDSYDYDGVASNIVVSVEIRFYGNPANFSATDTLIFVTSHNTGCFAAASIGITD